MLGDFGRINLVPVLYVFVLMSSASGGPRFLSTDEMNNFGLGSESRELVKTDHKNTVCRRQDKNRKSQKSCCR